tara:strand:+ start:134 stop:1069 length:936 start_codon:yes stop_codon:yes gene_type:complete
MGVKLLSSLLKSLCPNAIKQIHLSSLQNKKICVDTSIYLYRYKAQECLIEKFYLLCSIFKYYNIIPIFVFDGKPPEEKKEELEKRKIRKAKYVLEYNHLVQKFGSSPTEKQIQKLKKVKRNFTKITKYDILDIKSLLNSYGVQYIQAKGEADVLCASLVLKNKVHAVLTEDMDFFVYGCTNVLRYISLTNHTCLLYNLNDILKILNINFQNFQYICILGGTDYSENKHNIFYYFKIYNIFKSSENPHFINWLIDNNYINQLTNDKIHETLTIYQKGSDELQNYKYFIIRYGLVNKEELCKILKKERFIFYK